MRRLFSIAVALVLVFGSLPHVDAAKKKKSGNKPDAKARFATLDKNKDGKLTLDEFTGAKKGNKKKKK